MVESDCICDICQRHVTTDEMISVCTRCEAADTPLHRIEFLKERISELEARLNIREI